VFLIGQGMCGPTVMAYGSDADKRSTCRSSRPAKTIWCQLFSEPSAGSDVAGLRTRAEKEGDDWIINGQKSGPPARIISDYGILITRTDPTVPKHKGLTMFFLDMKSPGVDREADQAGQRPVGIQRGLFHRRADSRTRSGSARSATAGTCR
jgi:acyl-CoA dehydrogenase